MPRVIRINHIGLAAEDMESAVSFFAKGLGLQVEGSDVVAQDGVTVAFLPVGESRFEVLEPVGDEGPVQKFLEKRGPGLHHICLEVEDLRGMLRQLSAAGVELIDLEPRPGAHGTLVAFIHPKAASGVLIELVESASLHNSSY